MKFSHYEKMPGGSASEPEVLVRHNVLDEYGGPAVIHAGLAEMFGRIGLPATMSVRLYHGRWIGDGPTAQGISLGWCIPGTNTIYSAVNVNGPNYDLPRAPEENEDPTLAMPKLIRNSVRLGEERQHPIATVAATAFKVFTLGIGETPITDRRSLERDLMNTHYRDIHFDRANWHRK